MFVGRLTDEIFNNAKARPYSEGNSAFHVKMGWPIGLRYCEAGRTVTIFFDPLSRPRSWSHWLPFFLRSFSYQLFLDVEMETPIVWDNTEERPQTPDPLIQRRVEDALRLFGAPYTLRRTPVKAGQSLSAQCLSPEYGETVIVSAASNEAAHLQDHARPSPDE